MTENGNVPYLNWNDDRAKLNDNSDDNANPNYGTVSRGSVWHNPDYKSGFMLKENESSRQAFCPFLEGWFLSLDISFDQ